MKKENIFERNLEVARLFGKIMGCITPMVVDESDGRYNYSTADVDVTLRDYFREAGRLEVVEPKEKSYVLSVMLQNFVAEIAPAKDIQDEHFADNVRDVFFAEDSKMIIAHKGEKTTYIMSY